MYGSIAGLPISKPIEQALTFNMLIYGSSGVGKTMLAGSADGVPDLRRVLFVDIEGGTLTLRNSTYNEVEIVRAKSWTDLQKIYEELYLGNHDFRTVVIDSLTECMKMSMDSVMRRLVEENEERDADVPGIREWNINLEQTRKFVRRFRDLPVNTIFTALEKTDKNMRTGATKRMPSLSGKVASEIAAFLDIVAYLYSKELENENKRMLLTGHTEDTVAKDRTGLLPMIIDNPTMEVLYKHMNSSSTTTEPELVEIHPAER